MTALGDQAWMLRGWVWDAYFDAFLVSHTCLEIAYHAAEVGTMRRLKRAGVG